MQQYTWIYALTQPLTAAQEASVGEALAKLLAGWKTHGNPVKGVATIRYGRFIIAQADPNDGRPSGCSIDSLRHGIEEILQAHQLETFDPAEIFYRDAAGDLQHVDFREIPALIEAGRVGPGTLIFDHSLGQSDDLSRWEVPLQASWLKRYLKAERK
jgi:hypothetical protein